MYKHYKIIKKVQSFVFSRKRNLFSNKFDIIDIDTEKNIFNSETPLQELNFNDNLFYINTIFGKGYILNKTNIINLNEPVKYINYPYYLTYKKVEGQKFTLIKNLKNNYENKIKNTSTITLFSKTTFFRKDFQNEKIEAYEFPTLSALWQFNLTQLQASKNKSSNNPTAKWKIIKFIGVLDNKLWVALNHHTIIAINTNTGKLVFQLSDIPTFSSEWLPAAIPAPEATIINSNRNVLIGFMWEFYWEINPKTGRISFYDLSNYFKEQKVRKDRLAYIFDNEQIIFISNHTNKIAQFNIITKLINWQYQFKEKNKLNELPMLLQIKGTTVKFGVLDLAQNLYLFEKQKNETV